MCCRRAKLGKIQGGCRFDKGGVTKNFEFLRDKNINFLEVLRIATKKRPTFYEFLRIKKVHFLAILRKAIKKAYF